MWIKAEKDKDYPQALKIKHLGECKFLDVPAIQDGDIPATKEEIQLLEFSSLSAPAEFSDIGEVTDANGILYHTVPYNTPNGAPPLLIKTGDVYIGTDNEDVEIIGFIKGRKLAAKQPQLAAMPK